MLLPAAGQERRGSRGESEIGDTLGALAVFQRVPGTRAKLREEKVHLRSNLVGLMCFVLDSYSIV